MTEMYLYGLTIHGIQDYIFNTNALTEIIGASDIIENISKVVLKEKILPNSYNENNLLLAAAGSIKYLCTHKDALILFEKFPQIIMEIAGDIKFSQAVVKVSDEINNEHLIDLDKKLKANRNKPHNASDLALMTRTINRRTGEPTFESTKQPDGEYFDYTVKQKNKYKGARSVLNKVVENEKWIFPKELQELTNDKNKNFIAVVHADGNKLGATIHEILRSSNSNKTVLLKNLSLAIEESTVTAFKKAFNKVIIEKKNYKESQTKDDAEIIIPLRPVIIGGDDVTFIIRADLAIEFTNEYLNEFEKITKANFGQLGLKKGLSATAGIVFIKQKFPFHYAVNLVDSITSFVKNKTKREYSSLMFYKVQDSFINDYMDIIDKEFKPNDFDFENGPYSYQETNTLLSNVKTLSSNTVSVGAFRELLSIMHENKSNANFRWERIKKTQEDTIKKLSLHDKLEENNILFDLITLDSLTTDN